jgi:hypothetical protein
VSLGVIDTPMEQVNGAERDKIYQNMTANNLISRAGKAEEVAQSIVFWCKMILLPEQRLM